MNLEFQAVRQGDGVGAAQIEIPFRGIRHRLPLQIDHAGNPSALFGIGIRAFVPFSIQIPARNGQREGFDRLPCDAGFGTFADGRPDIVRAFGAQRVVR